MLLLYIVQLVFTYLNKYRAPFAWICVRTIPSGGFECSELQRWARGHDKQLIPSLCFLERAE